MADRLSARQGDTLDELIWRERGLGPADLPRILDLNPGLADRGAVLPIGTVVLLPPAPVTPARATLPLIQLWD